MPTSRRIWFRRVLIVAGALLCLGIPAYIELFLKRPVGTGPAGPPVAREAFAQPWTQRPVLLLGIGDSITRGLGAKSADHSFFQRLLVNPDDEWEDMRGLSLSAVLPNLTSENLSVSGSTLLAHADLIDERLETYPEEIFGLVVMTIYDPTDGVGDAASIFLPRWNDGLAIHARYNEAIGDVAAAHEHVHIVALYETFLGHGSHCRQFWRSTYRPDDPHYWFYSNIEDPNDRGYDAIRRVFLNTIIRNSVLHSPQQQRGISISVNQRSSAFISGSILRNPRPSSVPPHS